MPGLYVPIQDDFTRCKQVFRMAARMGKSRHEVVGLCCEFWGWASNEAEDGEEPGEVEGLLRDVSVDALIDALTTDRETAKSYFEAMFFVGWLKQHDHGLVIPEWNRWFSEKAKSRLLKGGRQSRWKAKSEQASPQASPQAPLRTSINEKENVNRRLRQTSVVDGDMNVWIRAKEYANRELKPKLGNKSKADQNTALKVAYLHVTGRIPESAVAESLDFGVVAKPWAIFTVRFKERVGGPARFKQLLASITVPTNIPTAADCGDLDELLASVKREAVA